MQTLDLDERPSSGGTVPAHHPGQRYFWPGNSVQRLASAPTVGLNDLALPPQAITGLEELVVIADAMRATQRGDGTYVSKDAWGSLLSRSNVIIDRLLTELGPDGTGLCIRSLPGGIWTNLRPEPGQHPARQLYFHWGPLGTWRSKSPRLLHSLLLAVQDAKSDELIQQFDKLVLASVGPELRTATGVEHIQLTEPPHFLCANALLRGGEAAIPPFHFAYFFPEDEGLEADQKTALVFGNGYRNRYEQITLPLAHRLLGASRSTGGAARQFVGQLLWLRAHDICHGIQLRTTDWKAIEDRFGSTTLAVLGEVMADVYGYLLISTPRVLTEFNLDAGDLACSFLAEMMNYLRREARFFPDSAAAGIELNFLIEHGYIHLNEDLSLEWSSGGLQNGFTHLARDFAEEVLGGDLGRIAAFISRYDLQSKACQGNAQSAPLLRLLAYGMPHIPTVASA